MEGKLPIEVHNADEESFIDAELEDFAVYREHRSNTSNRQKRLEESPRASELASLHEINERNVRLFFDGIIWYDGNRKYVQRVPFETLSIGGYGEMDSPAIESEIWIQSLEGKRHNVWYRLRAPAMEYARYHDPFMWMAELAKHVVAFMSNHQEIYLDHFRADFYTWLRRIYGSDDFILRWLKRYDSKDFRQILAAQANFLWCQASQVDSALERHPVWSEIHPVLLNAIPEQKERRTKAEMFAYSKEGSETISRRKTTVTPYVYNCFKHLPWEKFLYCQEPSVRQTLHYNTRLCHVSDNKLPSMRVAPQAGVSTQHANATVAVGDVVALPQDKMTAWKSNDEEWYAYVQSITETSEGSQLGLLWLYRPSDTQCLKVPYPFPEELFLSDHCNCGDLPIYVKEVLSKPRVAFFRESATKGVDYFVRQRYKEGDGAWQSLRESDFRCDCGMEKSGPRYSKGDTLLVHIKKTLEPVVLVDTEADGVADKIRIRRLLRRKGDCGDVNAEPNELVLTNRLEVLSRANVHRECHVRLYSEQESKQGKIPPPYNRQGMGDFFFITSQDLQDNGSGIQPLDASSFAYLKEGWNPSTTSSQPLMKGLDIFCGGGNLGHGLEEGGAVNFNWAVDLYNEAIHTYQANLKARGDTELFRGSVNDYLTQAMQGRGEHFVAQRGQVEVLVAGSPCQGYSSANPNRGNDRALLNCSLVASVVAFVDFYRPKYALMENVTGMARGPDTENTLALIISALVGMGYQVRTFGLDAWNFGSPQSRSRIFISIAAPGMTPLPEPPHTHSHPESVVSASLAKLANGLRASSRYTTPTPFKYVTSAEACNNLPATDARTSCIPFPDHRMSRTLSTLARIQIGSIPRFPGGCTFVTAASRGYMPQPQMDAFNWKNEMRSKKTARGWQRVKRDRLMPTVMTEPRPDDGAGGTCLHWDEERLLTIMEVRRGQGFVHDDILIGSPKDQWKIVGNSVARPVALALGVSLRKAWLANSTALPKDADVPKSCLSTKVAHDSATLDTRFGLEVANAGSASSHSIANMTIIDKCMSKGASWTSSEARPFDIPSSAGHLLKESIEQSTVSPHSAGPNDRRSIQTSSQNILCPKSGEPQSIGSKTDDLPVDNEHSHQYRSENSHAVSVANSGSPLPGAGKFADESKSNRATLSISPQTHFISRETTISKITIKTTTTIRRRQVEPSPEL